jgi:hypothetical protein
MLKSLLGPVLISLGLIGSTVFVAMAIVIRLADRDAISLGQGIAVFATFITGGLAITSAVWLSWYLAR